MRSDLWVCLRAALTACVFIFVGCDEGAGRAPADDPDPQAPDATVAPDALPPDAALPSTCADGALDEGEACDDGNVEDGDGCSAQCQIEICGNGTVDFGEQCDDGNDRPADVCFDCRHVGPLLCDGSCDARGTAGGTPVLQTLPLGEGQRAGSVALSGDVALVGGRSSAYLFTRDAQGQWSQAERLSPDDDAMGFGDSVALSGDVALVGAPNDALGGSAYLFTRDAQGQWVQTQKLIPDGVQREGNFGFSVALSGDVALVGGLNDSAAYLFTRDAQGQWVQTQKLSGDEFLFGFSVTLSGDVALVGSYSDLGIGLVYVFTRGAQGRWSQTQTLTAVDDGGQGFLFGVSVALSGDVALVGGNSQFQLHQGSAYLFTRDAQGQWVRTQTLRPVDPSEVTFGSSVALSGNVALVGPGAYVFTRDAQGQWVQTQKLTANNVDYNNSVALTADGALVPGAPGSNSARFFDLAGPRCFDDGSCVCVDGADALLCAGRPACGDGTTQDAEQCDDGNLDPGDGCDASCNVEP